MAKFDESDDDDDFMDKLLSGELIREHVRYFNEWAMEMYGIGPLFNEDI